MSFMKKHRGLGDTVEAVTQATGIKAIVEAGSKAFNKPCGSAECGFGCSCGCFFSNSEI